MEVTRTGDPIVVIDGVIRIYREADVETVALRGVDLEVRRGESVAIMGRSGSGKSTLLNLIAGLDRPSAGRVVVDGIDIGRADESVRETVRGRRAGLVLQSQNLVPHLTIEENVRLSAAFAGMETSDEKVASVLSRMHLEDRASHRPDELSGGEQQRAGLACVAIAEPPLLLGDEVTGELDSASAALVMKLLGDLNDSGTTVFLVTHDPSIAVRTQRVVELRDGRVVSDGAA